VSTSIQTFRRALRAHGVEVDLIAPHYGGDAEADDVVRIPARPVPRDPEDRLMRFSRLKAAALQLSRHADLVHVQTPFAAHYAGLWAARRRHIPAIATYHTLFEEYLHHYAPFVPARGLRAAARALSRSQCNALDAVVVPSLAMRDRLAQYGVVRPVHVIPTGIGLAPYGTGRRHVFRAAYDIPEDRPVALFVGRVAHEKNIDFLLEAMVRVRRRVPSALLLVTGDGPALPHLKRRSVELELTEYVRFLGYLDRARTLPDCYAAADVFAFASKTETQGLVLLEAMASGCPVVALSEMGTRDILDRTLGLSAKYVVVYERERRNSLCRYWVRAGFTPRRLKAFS
jgi:1,2-diacylglycerol 3-alpha-glucosyltransferase